MRKPCLVVTAFIAWVVSAGIGNPNQALANVPLQTDQKSSKVTRLEFGTHVQVELLQDLNDHTTGKIENVRLRVLKSVWVGNLIVIAAGAEASGTASVKNPTRGENGEISLRANSAVSVNGMQIPLYGGHSSRGSVDCESIDCISYFFVDGAHAQMGRGLDFEADVSEDVVLPTEELQSFMDEQVAKVDRAIRRCDHITSLRVYLLSRDSERAQKVFLDGKVVGSVSPGSVLTLVPPPGVHVLAIKKSSVTVNLQRCAPYYARILRLPTLGRSALAIEMNSPVRGEDETRDLHEVEYRK
jgi:hypothetical protein